MGSKRQIPQTRSERGATLVFLGVALVALLGVMSLALDLGMLYVARNDAQRSADAAALAGAYSFFSSNCLAAGTCGPIFEPGAISQAQAVAAQNLVLQESVVPQNPDDFSFDFSRPNEPQVSVTIQRSVARGNAVPTIFAKIFGTYLATVVATATAEAYQGASSVSCVAPFLVPNCVSPPVAGDAINPTCSTYSGGPYAASALLYPSPDGNPNDSTPAPGIVGTKWSLHFGDAPSASAAPSQWYMIAFVNQSGSLTRQEIEQCTPFPVACGTVLNTLDGKKVGPVDQGVEARINASGLGMNQGQDTIEDPSSTTDTNPLTIDIGSNNPLLQTPGNTLQAGQDYGGPSPSTVTVPVYQGQALQSGGSQVTVIGYALLFISDVNHIGGTDNVDATVLGALPCDSNTGVTTAAGGVPIRLIRTSN